MKTKYASCAMLACIASAAALGNNSRSTTTKARISRNITLSHGVLTMRIRSNTRYWRQRYPMLLAGVSPIWTFGTILYLTTTFRLRTEEEQMIKLVV